jgi:hypothetical protein
MIRQFLGCFLVISIPFSTCQADVARPARVGDAPATSPAIVIGFVGGYIRHDDPMHIEVQLTVRVRKDNQGGAVVDTFENRNGEKAYREILSLLDANHDGTLNDEEKRNAPIILYGHS